jgi:hypothetical protein
VKNVPTFVLHNFARFALTSPAINPKKYIWRSDDTRFSRERYLSLFAKSWRWEKTGVFRFKNPIWRFYFPMKKLCFRFSAKF